MAGRTSKKTSGGREQSIFFAILVPMLLLLMAEVILFLMVLGASGIVGRLNENDCIIMDKQVESRRNYLQSYLVGMGEEVALLAEQTNELTQKNIDEGTFKLDDLSTNSSASSKLLRELVTPMISTLRQCSSSGVFVVFNTQDLTQANETGDFGRKFGAYLRDMDPASTPSARNEDLVFERASTEVVQAFSITTGTEWKPAYDLNNRVREYDYNFLYLPFQTSFEIKGEKDATDFAYWGVAPIGGESEEGRAMTYSIPLILDDGTVYGVIGIDLTSDYLKSLLPFEELVAEEDGSYLLARYEVEEKDVQPGQSVQTYPVVYNGYRAIDNTEFGRVFSIVHSDETSYAAHTMGGQYYISYAPLKLYNSNAPFEHQRWVLMGLVPNTTLHLFTDQVVVMIGVATLFMMILGLLGSILLGRNISRPIRRLSNEVAAAQIDSSDVITMSTTGITEVDQLTSAITELSSEVASARRLEQERIEYERDFDLLTGLMNRRAFYRRAHEIFSNPDILKRAAIVMLDLDNLKMLNDTYGHDCGDKYIFQAARCFESSVPPDVVVSRVSGDEFFMLFYGYDSREAIEADIEVLRQAIPATAFKLPDGKTTYINASGGVALYLEDSNEFAELMKLADFTMYQVKEAGKNNIAFFDLDTYRKSTSALRGLAEFDSLLADYSQVDYHFQPMVDAHTGKVFAYEALMRVSMDVLQSPLDVLSFARQEKRMIDVERMTWVRSLECFKALQDKGVIHDNELLFINSFANISVPEEDLSEIAQSFASIMPKVVIEITEAEDMDEKATEIKRSLLGFSGMFALDDYGSGYNSELMLLTLHPKFVKIDLSIVRNINKSHDKQRIVSHITEYAHERDMLIVAEGVETAEELDTLLDLKVDLMQGYYLAKPAAEPSEISPEALAQIHARIENN